jgi:hypothetical protein
LRLFRLAVVPVSVLLTLAAAELALRWGGFAGESVELHARLLVHDPELGWAKVRNGEAAYRWQGRRIVETSNSQGARGPGPDGAPVLFLGDSFCEGYLVNDDEVFSAVLRREFDIAAVNHGVVGYSTDQELLLYRRIAPIYKARQVIVLFFDNDVWFNAREREHRAAKPQFLLTDGQLELTGRPIPPPDPQTLAAPAAGRPQPLRLVRLWDRFRARAASPAPATIEPAKELLLYRVAPSTEVENAWRLTEAILAQFDADVRANGAELTVFYVPSVAAVSDEAWRRTQSVYGMSDGEWDIGVVEERLAETCARLGISLVSPTEALREQHYYPADGHWNAAGHSAVAKILRDHMRAGTPVRDRGHDVTL